MTTADKAKDPVCGMDVTIASAPAKSEYKGDTFYFCDVSCKAKFDAAPEQYLGQTTAAMPA